MMSKRKTKKEKRKEEGERGEEGADKLIRSAERRRRGVEGDSRKGADLRLRDKNKTGITLRRRHRSCSENVSARGTRPFRSPAERGEKFRNLMSIMPDTVFKGLVVMMGTRVFAKAENGPRRAMSRLGELGKAKSRQAGEDAKIKRQGEKETERKREKESTVRVSSVVEEVTLDDERPAGMGGGVNEGEEGDMASEGVATRRDKGAGGR